MRGGLLAAVVAGVLGAALPVAADSGKNDSTTSSTSSVTSTSSTTTTAPKSNGNSATSTSSTSTTDKDNKDEDEQGSDTTVSDTDGDEGDDGKGKGDDGKGKGDDGKDKDDKDRTPVLVEAHAWSTTGNSHLSARAHDGNPATEFVTQMQSWAPPTWAWLKADLGGNTPLTRIEWMWSTSGGADAFTVEVSNGNGKWLTIAQPGEAPPGQWTGVTLERETRFVRFEWRNPNNDAQLGHLAEVRFYARPGVEPDGKGMTRQPSDVVNSSEGSVGEKQTPATKGDHWVVQRSSRSSNSPDKSSRLPLDGKSDTAWQTALATTPRTGWTMYDLGDVVSVPAVKWKFSQVGAADRFLVQVSDNGTKWTTISEQTNAPAADTWVRLDTDTKARFVRFFFTNPNGDPNLGHLSEVRFLHP